jgi:hypothetical protein
MGSEKHEKEKSDSIRLDFYGAEEIDLRDKKEKVRN